MSILENAKDEVYELAYYTVPNENGNLPVHKKINMKVHRDIMGNPIKTEVYGSWRKGGFWTDKNFPAEEPISELITKLDNLFDTTIVADDKLFFKSKQTMSKMVEETFKNVMIPDKKAKLLEHIPYGVDHNALQFSTPPTQFGR
jgi:hypothetical protein